MKLNYVLVFLVGVCLMSCELASIDDLAELSESAKNHADMSGEYNSIFEFVNSIGTEDPGLAGKSTFGILPACATATIDQQTRTLEVDFGSGGCLCKDGISR
ncbi:MAG: hypothetical protein HKN22_06030 [Bacteroidia bacterium]|nr:hypothetical protein [Bacteroidia bacterium]